MHNEESKWQPIWCNICSKDLCVQVFDELEWAIMWGIIWNWDVTIFLGSVWMVFGGMWSNYMITMMGVMYWAPEMLIHYSCENFGTTQWFYCQLIIHLTLIQRLTTSLHFKEIMVWFVENCITRSFKDWSTTSECVVQFCAIHNALFMVSNYIHLPMSLQTLCLSTPKTFAATLLLLLVDPNGNIHTMSLARTKSNFFWFDKCSIYNPYIFVWQHLMVLLHIL